MDRELIADTARHRYAWRPRSSTCPEAYYIVLARPLAAEGLNTDDLQRRRVERAMFPLLRGAYAYAPGHDLAAEQLHRRLVLATAPQLLDGSVGQPRLGRSPAWSARAGRLPSRRSTSPASRSGHGKRRSVVHVHGAPLPAADLTVATIMITSLARTVPDLGRTRPMDQAVAAGTSASLGLEPADARLRGAAWRWPTVRVARRGPAASCSTRQRDRRRVGTSRVRLHLDGVPRAGPPAGDPRRHGQVIAGGLLRHDSGSPASSTAR